MVQPGIGGLDTPRTNLGDATYLTNKEQLDFDLSQEQSFQSPSKDSNLVQQLQNGRRGAVNLRTPRSRVALNDRRNLPPTLAGGEFTPMLKSATRNSALRNGKENAIQTPAFLKPAGLANIPEDFSPLPQMGSSIYGQDSRNGSYMAGTPVPHIDSSSTASTPMALLPRRNEGPGVLQDSNQLSLREQENVIDKIEKENFGLKLKIHFLEEALRKAGPGFSEAALKENTELKVDKVTMQKELHRYRKTLTAAERDVELYRQQILEMQEKIRRKHTDESQKEELDRLQQALEEKEAEIDQLKGQGDRFDDFQDKIQDLEADLREKDRIINDREDEVENLKDEVEKHVDAISDLEDAAKKAQRREVELEEKAQVAEDFAEAKETIEELEHDLERLKKELKDTKEDRQEAIREKDRAQGDLDELQDEMANKSMTTKGLSRQIEEKANRLQDDLDDLREKHSTLEEEHADKLRGMKRLQDTLEALRQDGEVREQRLKDKLDIVENDKQILARERGDLSSTLNALQKDLQQVGDEKNLLQVRHDTLTAESAGLQKELAKSHKTIEDLEERLDHERTLALTNERGVRDEYKADIDRLNEEIEDIRDEVRQKERLHDDDSDKWESERRHLELQKDRAEEQAAGLQRTIDRLQDAEGTLSGKETKLQHALESEKERHENQEALLNRQISELNEDLQTRRKSLEEVKSELASVREELRLSQREQKSLLEKMEGLEDEVEILQTTLDEESERSSQEISAAKQESEGLRRQLQASRLELANAESAIAGARAEVETFQGDLQTREGSREQVNFRLREVETQLAKIRQDKQSLQDQLAKSNIEIHSARASRTEIEAERDELQSQMRALKEHEEETFRLDRERIDLRTAKMKLDAEVRRLQKEVKIAAGRQETLEKELQQEIEKANTEETRLKSKFHDLQRILRGSSEKKELANAKDTIRQLEERIRALEDQVESGDHPADATNELSIIRRDLSAARQKETEYLQREAAQKDILRTLKRQISELERRSHEAEISRFAISSPQSSSSGSARKSEIAEVRHQLAMAHQSLRDLRTQLKDVEKDTARKLHAANVDLEARTEAWESEKDQLEHSLDEALLQKDELAAKNNTSEGTINRLRGKISRLEKALQAERLNSGEDRTIVLERRDLHEMLRETQIEAESLEVVVKDREAAIAAITATEADLRAQLKRVRDDRALQRSRAASAHEDLDELERRFRRAQESWETERKALTQGVRFANMSLSVNDESEILALKRDSEEREKRHVKELRGLSMQIEWLRARCKREEGFRAAASYVKRYMGLQIDLYEACNKADLALLQTTGIELPPKPQKERRPTLRTAALAVRAAIRMRKGAEQWAKSRKIHDALLAKVEAMRKDTDGGRKRDVVLGLARKKSRRSIAGP